MGDRDSPGGRCECEWKSGEERSPEGSGWGGHEQWLLEVSRVAAELHLVGRFSRGREVRETGRRGEGVKSVITQYFCVSCTYFWYVVSDVGI